MNAARDLADYYTVEADNIPSLLHAIALLADGGEPQ